MSANNLSQTDGAQVNHQELGPEEQAVLGIGGSTAVRKAIANVWQLKLRLQYSGWLQYIPTALLSIGLFLAAWIVRTLGTGEIPNIMIALGSILLLILIFDLFTVKFHIRPPEHLPKRKDDLGLFDLMRSRRSCRSYQLRKLTPPDHAEFMESVRLHGQAPKIGKSPIRFEYISAPLTVWPVVNATEFLVAIVPSEYNRLAVIDVGRTLQKIVMDATRMGLGTCWIGPGADHTSIIRELGDRFNPREDHIICVCAIGYKSWYSPLFVRALTAQFRRRLPLSSLFFADPQFKEPLNVEVFPFNRFDRNYEICQWSPSSFNGQTTRCVPVMEQKEADKWASDEDAHRLARFDFYASIQSRYYAPVALGIWLANWEMGCEALGIKGNFALLSAEERGFPAENDRGQLPRYDMSWVLNE